jgi:hypothetical protein
MDPQNARNMRLLDKPDVFRVLYLPSHWTKYTDEKWEEVYGEAKWLETKKEESYNDEWARMWGKVYFSKIKCQDVSAFISEYTLKITFVGYITLGKERRLNHGEKEYYLREFAKWTDRLLRKNLENQVDSSFRVILAQNCKWREVARELAEDLTRLLAVYYRFEREYKFVWHSYECKFNWWGIISGIPEQKKGNRERSSSI